MDAVLAANIIEATSNPINKVAESDAKITDAESPILNRNTRKDEVSPLAVVGLAVGPVKSVPLSSVVRYNDSIVICGSDSDILLQAMILSTKFPNIAVLQSGVCECVCVYVGVGVCDCTLPLT